MAYILMIFYFYLKNFSQYQKIEEIHSSFKRDITRFKEKVFDEIVGKTVITQYKNLIFLEYNDNY